MIRREEPPGRDGRTAVVSRRSVLTVDGSCSKGILQRLGDALKRTLVAASRLPQDGAAGYRRSSAAERAVFHMTSSFAVTIVASRGLNFVRERRRPLPRVRSVGRLLSQVLASNRLRVHHFLPGMVIGFATGGTAILRSPGGGSHWLSVPFGVGVALTTDELRVMAGRSNPYWGGESFAAAQAALSALASAGLSVRFVKRGRSAVRVTDATRGDARCGADQSARLN